MAKSYPEQLGEWVKRRESTKRDKNLVAFLAVRDDVKAAVEAGYAVKTVWTNMHEAGRVQFGYDTFLNYVNRLIRRPQVDKAAKLTDASSTATATDTSSKPKPAEKKAAAKTPKPAAPSGFTFNPSPDKKDLL
ncbi:MAG: TraK family protein [Burkholderia sp.]